MSDVKNYDICVIGSGGGAKIATPASRLGFKVAYCEMDRFGGTCLNRGCIPSKMLIHVAEVAETIRHAKTYKITPNEFEVDFEGVVQRCMDEIDEETFSINPMIEKNENIDWYKEPAKFVGERRLRSGDVEFTADRVFIVAGARPKVPAIPGLEGTPYMTSAEALRHPKKPKHLIVVGAGYIATELGFFYAALGVKTTFMVRSSFLRAEDEEVQTEFNRVFRERFDTLQASPTRVAHANGTFTVTYKEAGSEEEKTIEGDELLMVTGVQPNSDTLDVAACGVELKAGGYVKVDDYLRTNVPNVWAFGDIVGDHLFRHAANMQGNYLFENVIKQPKGEPNLAKTIDYTGMPHAVFSSPQIAGAGLTEQEARAAGKDFVKGVNPYKNSAMGMALRSDSGFVKLLIERGTRKILGVHAIGHEASVLVHEILPLFRLGGTVDDVVLTIHIHPALSELVRNSARRAVKALVAAGDDVPLAVQLA